MSTSLFKYILALITAFYYIVINRWYFFLLDDKKDIHVNLLFKNIILRF
jgi:hypothetical protein